MTSDRPQSAEQFLEIRHQLTQTGDIHKVLELDEELCGLAATDPDQASSIMGALARSDDFGAKEAVAVYVQFLFPTRPHQARELLLSLLKDPDDDIQSQALDTLDIVTSDRWITRAEANKLVKSKG
jgi:hypothetical protein